MPDRRRVYRWDPYDTDEGNLEFFLTYEGPLKSMRPDGARVYRRAHHVHDIRRVFHRQLKALWEKHPTFQKLTDYARRKGRERETLGLLDRDGFTWQPMVSETSGVVCRVDILMLREGQPGSVVYDIDNRVKTLFDALRMPLNPAELGAGSDPGQRTPQIGETPFFVLLEQDSLITHLAVTSETLLDPVPFIEQDGKQVPVPRDEAVRLFIKVNTRAYDVTLENLHHAG